MANTQSIKVDYEKVKLLSKHFDDHAVAIGQWFAQLEAAVEELQPGWKGLAANQFAKDWESLRPKIRHTMNALSEAHMDLQYIGAIFHDAETGAKDHITALLEQMNRLDALLGN